MSKFPSPPLSSLAHSALMASTGLYIFRPSSLTRPVLAAHLFCSISLRGFQQGVHSPSSSWQWLPRKEDVQTPGSQVRLNGSKAGLTMASKILTQSSCLTASIVRQKLAAPSCQGSSAHLEALAASGPSKVMRPAGSNRASRNLGAVTLSGS